MEKRERRKTMLEADLEDGRAKLKELAEGPYEMYEFSDTLKSVMQDIDDVMEHAFWYEKLLSTKTGEPMRFADEKKPDDTNSLDGCSDKPDE